MIFRKNETLNRFHFLLFQGNGAFVWICPEISREKYRNKNLVDTLKLYWENNVEEIHMEIRDRGEYCVREWENTRLLIDKISSSISDGKRGRTEAPYQRRIVTSSLRLSSIEENLQLRAEISPRAIGVTKILCRIRRKHVIHWTISTPIMLRSGQVGPSYRRFRSCPPEQQRNIKKENVFVLVHRENFADPSIKRWQSARQIFLWNNRWENGTDCIITYIYYNVILFIYFLSVEIHLLQSIEIFIFIKQFEQLDFIYSNVKQISMEYIFQEEELIIIINCWILEMLVFDITFLLHLFSKFIPRFSNCSDKKERRREEGRNTIDGEFVSGLSFRSLSRLPSDYVRLTNVDRTREPHETVTYSKGYKWNKSELRIDPSRKWSVLSI